MTDRGWLLQLKPSLRRALFLLLAIAVVTSVVAIASALELNKLRSASAGERDSASVVLFGANLVLAFTLGLRHAIDADHIAAVDNVTRRLLSFALYASSPPIATGFWFSLGHSSVVFVATTVVVASANAALLASGDVQGVVEDRLAGFARIGGIVGTSVSAVFLLVIGVGNAVVLAGIWKDVRVGRSGVTGRVEGESEEVAKGGTVTRTDSDPTDETVVTVDYVEPLPVDALTEPSPNTPDSDRPSPPVSTVDRNAPSGFLTRLVTPVLDAVNRPWKMFPVGVLFGLGFDTAMGVIVLAVGGMQAISSTPGSLWPALLLPLLFACAMVFVDTLDGVLMVAVYSWAYRTGGSRVWYNVFITTASLLIALSISLLQFLHLAHDVPSEPPQGAFWDFLENLDSQIIGGVVVGTLLVSWGVASGAAVWSKRRVR